MSFDPAAYRAAVEPWAKKAERERREITHVRYHHGHADVTLEARKRVESVPDAGQLL